MKSTLTILVALLVTVPAMAEQPNKPIRIAGMCVLLGEKTSGAYKFCNYNCPAGTYTIEVKPLERCPSTIDH
jgi:hypothetical protein